MTVLEAIQKSTAFLEHKGVESPRLQVELLLAATLRMPRLKLYLDFERVLAPEQIQTLRELVLQRGRHIPLQHLLGNTSFCGHDIIVNRDVLIPRPETEQLAERALEFLNAWPGKSPLHALDFGTGSGCLALTLALALPRLEIDAVDISEAALSVARRNIQHHGVADRIELLHGDGFDALAAGRRYALILSNPPYIPTADIATLDPEVRDHDPHDALDGGADGLDFYRRLATDAAPWLAPGGRSMVELGHGQKEAVSQLFTQAGWQIRGVHDDDNGIPRIFIACRPGT